MSHRPPSTTSLGRPVGTVQASQGTRPADPGRDLALCAALAAGEAGAPKLASEISVSVAILSLAGGGGGEASLSPWSLPLFGSHTVCLPVPAVPTDIQGGKPNPLTKSAFSLVCLTFLRRVNGGGSGRAPHVPSLSPRHHPPPPARCEEWLLEEGVAVPPASPRGQLWGGSRQNPTPLRQLAL